MKEIHFPTSSDWQAQVSRTDWSIAINSGNAPITISLVTQAGIREQRD
jgi:hypothetical protein